MPGRKIPPNTRSVTGRRQSRKNGHRVEVESNLEAGYAALLEFDPAVSRYETQVSIEYQRPDGKLQAAWPDFLVFFTDQSRRPQLVDVKYRSEIFSKWARLKPRFVGARRYALERGWTYRLQSEIEIKTPYLANARFLLPYRRLHPSHEDKELLTGKLAALSSETPSTLLRECSSDAMRMGQLIPVLWHLVSTFQIGADLANPLHMRSRLWLHK